MSTIKLRYKMVYPRVRLKPGKTREGPRLPGHERTKEDINCSGLFEGVYGLDSVVAGGINLLKHEGKLSGFAP
jgi:hypothetical protein